MLTDEKTDIVEQRFNDLYEIIRSDRFLKMEGLGNEVPFFISPFQSQNQNLVDRLILSLKQRLDVDGIQVLLLNLYDLCINKLEKDGDLDLVLKKEPDWSKRELRDQLLALLDPEYELIPDIAKIAKEESYKAVFLTGIGLVFPFIRSHSILNNLQKVFSNTPLIMFYPGEYLHDPQLGSSLNLFAKLKGSKYYRAFNINNLKI